MVFTKDHIFSYVRNAPGTLVHIRSKVILLAGYYGALRCDDLVKLKWGDLKFKPGVGIWVQLLDRKTGVVQETHTFLMQASDFDEKICAIQLAEAYQNLLKKPLSRVFMSIRSGKFTDTPLGKNSLREVPKMIATFLNLMNPQSYTGQCFRRTSATALADRGISLTNLKQHAGWKSDTVAEGYIANSKKMRRDIAEMLAPDQEETEKSSASETLSRPNPSKPSPSINISFSNCNTVNFGSLEKLVDQECRKFSSNFDTLVKNDV